MVDANQERVTVTVIIPCRNEIHFIRKFLDTAVRQDTTGMNLEILVADGMSDDGTRKVLHEYERDYPNLKIIDNPQQFVSTGLNAAIREAHGEFIARMDAHTEYAPDYIRACLQVLLETGAENVGGPAFTRAEGYSAEAIARAFHSKFVSGGSRFHDVWFEGEVSTVPYGFWRKSTLIRAGLFDERLYRSQDDELNLRLRNAGGKIWQSPKIISWYRPRSTIHSLSRQYFQYGFWKVAVIRKHKKPASLRNLVPGASLLSVILLLAGIFATGLAGRTWWEAKLTFALTSLAGVYLAVSFCAAFLVARHGGWRYFPVFPIIFAAYHFSYGLGFLLAFAYRPITWDQPGYLRRILTTITR